MLSYLCKTSECILISLFLIACTQTNKKAKQAEEQSTHPYKHLPSIHLSYATAYNLKITNNSAQILIPEPWKGTNTAFHYNLVQKEHGTSGKGITIHVPVNKITCFSGPHVAMLAALNATDKICSVPDAKLLHNEAVIQQVKAGKIEETGSMGSPDFEKLVSVDPDIVLESATGSKYDNYPKLKEMGLTPFIFSAYREQHPLGRLEWIKALGLLTGKYPKAVQYFETVEQKYTTLKQQADSFPDPPTVAAGYIKRGKWVAPGGRSYMARFIEDAGGDYLLNDSTSGNRHMSLETMLNKASEADYWIIHPYSKVKTMQGLLNKEPRLEALDCVQSENVFNNNKQLNKAGRNAFWESGYTHPHTILKDLITIFNRDNSKKEVLTYFRKID